jgi:hypothetical protein
MKGGVRATCGSANSAFHIQGYIFASMSGLLKNIHGPQKKPTRLRGCLRVNVACYYFTTLISSTGFVILEKEEINNKNHGRGRATGIWRCRRKKGRKEETRDCHTAVPTFSLDWLFDITRTLTGIGGCKHGRSSRQLDAANLYQRECSIRQVFDQSWQEIGFLPVGVA